MNKPEQRDLERRLSGRMIVAVDLDGWLTQIHLDDGTTLQGEALDSDLGIVWEMAPNGYLEEQESG